MSDNARATKGDVVTIHYTGRLQDGTVFDTSKGKDPLKFKIGEGRIISGIEDAVEGMKPGESRTAELGVADAYGPRRPDLLLNVSRSELPDGMSPSVGDDLAMRTPNGETVPVRVTEVGEESVVLDANHPLAGENLVFEIDLVEIG